MQTPGAERLHPAKADSGLVMGKYTPKYLAMKRHYVCVCMRERERKKAKEGGKEEM